MQKKNRRDAEKIAVRCELAVYLNISFLLVSISERINAIIHPISIIENKKSQSVWLNTNAYLYLSPFEEALLVAVGDIQ